MVTERRGESEAAPGSIRRLGQLYRVTIVDAGRGEGFLIATSFLLTTLIVRAITHAIRDQRFHFLFHNVSPSSGLHIHHMVFGIIGLLVAGMVSVAYRPEGRWQRRILAVAFGVSAALTLDEFALWLRLEDVYWSAQGRESVYALILGAAISLLPCRDSAFGARSDVISPGSSPDAVAPIPTFGRGSRRGLTRGTTAGEAVRRPMQARQ